MLTFLITLVVNALTLLILSFIPPLGIEVKPLGALLGGAIIGLFNGIWGLFPQALRTFTTVLSLGVVPLIGAIIVFGLAAALVEGFRLRFGFWSLILGAISFAIVNSVLFWLLRQTGLLAI